MAGGRLSGWPKNSHAENNQGVFMKRLWGLVCASALVAGCGPEIDLAARPLFSNGVNTITFMVYDGFTGGGVESAELRVLVGGYSVEATRDGNIYVVSQL